MCVCGGSEFEEKHHSYKIDYRLHEQMAFKNCR